MYALYIGSTLYITGLPLPEAYALACRLAAEFAVTVRLVGEAGRTTH